MPTDLAQNPCESAARTVYAWLRADEPLPAEPVDLAVAFGHFDLGIPRRATELVLQGRARALLLTGGVGAGSADFSRPEAVEFLDEVRRLSPALAPSALVEDRSTNTGENIRFSLELIARDRPELSPGRGLRSAILCATGLRMRRVLLTWRRHLPQVPAAPAPSAGSFEEDAALFRTKGQDLASQLAGEVDRILAYPQRGWTVPESVPDAVLAATQVLKSVATGG